MNRSQSSPNVRITAKGVSYFEAVHGLMRADNIFRTKGLSTKPPMPLDVSLHRNGRSAGVAYRSALSMLGRS